MHLHGPLRKSPREQPASDRGVHWHDRIEEVVAALEARPCSRPAGVDQLVDLLFFATVIVQQGIELQSVDAGIGFQSLARGWPSRAGSRPGPPQHLLDITP